MPKFIDLTGEIFGRLTVIRRGENSGKKTGWHCRCDCGNETNIPASHLANGHTKSCGCLVVEKIIARCTKHGAKSRIETSREYESWSGAKARCFRLTHRRYKEWGGRGITMCERWRNSFEAFYADMGPRPKGHSLDRIDNDGNYEPGNCRWATNSEQASNTRPRKKGNPKFQPCRRFIECNGRSLSIGEWARELGIPHGRLRTRIRRGWPIEKALS